MAQRLDRARVLAYRAWAQGLHGTVRVGDLDALSVGLQDTPAGSAVLALRQRTRTPVPLDRPDLVLALTMRGAPHLHRRDDLPLIRAALRPRDNESLRAFLGGFGDTLVASGADGPAVLTQVADTMRARFPGATPTKGELSSAINPDVPELVRPWCARCGSAHVDDGLFRLATLYAGIELVPGDDRRLRFRLGPAEQAGATAGDLSGRDGPVAAGRDGPAAVELLRAAVRLAGPLTLGDLVSWLDTRPVTAPPDWLRPLWADLAGELVAVEVDGEALFAAADMVQALGEVPAAPPVRLLPPRDQYLLGRRTFLVPDRALAKEVWRPVGSPGALVLDGELAGTWRARTSGRTLRLAVTPRRALTAGQRGDLERQAEVVAAARGHDGKVVVALA